MFEFILAVVCIYLLVCNARNIDRIEELECEFDYLKREHKRLSRMFNFQFFGSFSVARKFSMRQLENFIKNLIGN